jgi:twitching motility protein PilT
MTDDYLWEMIHSVLDVQEATWSGDHDFSFSYGGRRFRANAYQERGHPALALRMIPSDVPVFAELGLPESLKQVVGLRQGLVLICGPTGSGKSTTMASVVDMINETRGEHIVSLEDPIEYLHRNKRSVIHQREVSEIGSGGDTASFATGMRSVLRQDPDIILIGEMRDLETIHAALTAAETGHLVFATLHCQSVEDTIKRVIDVFPAEQQQEIRTLLATVLKVVAVQAIFPRADEPGKRCVVFELMFPSDAAASLIREAKQHQMTSHLENHGKEGNQTFDMGLARAVAAGYIDQLEAQNWAHDNQSFLNHLAKERMGSPRGDMWRAA